MAYQASKIFTKLVTSTFFRDIQVIGEENIPKDGPLLLYGNHNNQFIDPLLIVANVPRQVSFIAAAKSMKRPIIGHVGRLLGGIPVERPQDLAKKGSGTIVGLERDTIIGYGTRFKSECKAGDTLVINNVGELLVIEVLDDTKIKTKQDEHSGQVVGEHIYKIQPKVDQSKLFESVWQALNGGACIGIFPEGGSHDNTTLLPLKPGICIMALGAGQKYKTKVYLQPVGLNYFKGHKFRSKVIMEFGLPIEISQELLEMYTQNKRLAIQTLLTATETHLKMVTLQAPTYSDLSALMMIRTLYLPDKIRLNPKESLELMKRFTSGFQQFGEHPEVKQILMEVKMYNYRLKAMGVQDYQVMRMQKNALKDIYVISLNLIMTIISLAFALPGFIMSAPIAILLNTLTERERKKALANSKVKVQGKDVVASYKILTSFVLVPISIILYTILFYISLIRWDFVADHNRLKATLIFFLSWPIYIVGMIRSNDGLVRRARKLKTLVLFYLYESKYRKIKKQREKLQENIRKMVEVWGDNLIPDFQRNRIVNFNETVDDNNIDINQVFESLQDLGI